MLLDHLPISRADFCLGNHYLAIQHIDMKTEKFHENGFLKKIFKDSLTVLKVSSF